jgi:DNA-binding NarL/FixJ family response regulator
MQSRIHQGTTMATITVFLADDNGDMLTDLRDELAGQFLISGTAGNGQDAVREVLRSGPDVLVLDITMPLLNGLQVAEQLRASNCRTKILFLTIHEEPEYISAAFCAGAYGYVSKRHLASDLVHAIREVFGGRKFLSPTLQK